MWTLSSKSWISTKFSFSAKCTFSAKWIFSAIDSLGATFLSKGPYHLDKTFIHERYRIPEQYVQEEKIYFDPLHIHLGK